MYIGIDIGGTNVRVAVIENLADVNLNRVVRAENKKDFQQDIEQIKSLIYKVTGTKPGDNLIRAIALGLPAEINKEGTGADSYAALPSWNKQPIKDILAKEFFTEVLIENDTTCAALGEAFFGLGRDKDFVFIIWGTGIGGAQIINIEGHMHAFGFEPGHHLISDGNSIKAFEEFAGGRGVSNWLGKPAETLTEEEWELVTDKMAYGLVNVLAMRRTELFIMGGGIALKQSQRLPVIQAKMKEKLAGLPQNLIVPEIKPAQLGEDAGLFGTFALIKRDAQINSRLQRVYGQG